MSSSRQSSIGSTTGPSSPLIGPRLSPELVHADDADFPNTELDFSSDDEQSDDFAAQPDRLNASIIPPLSPTHVLLYLSIPYLKLGPMFLPASDTPLSQSIPTLLICAAFATFTRELWYLLARYLRKMDIEEVVLDVFARGSDKARRRLLLRLIVRVGGSHIPLLSFFGKLTCSSFCWTTIGGLTKPTTHGHQDLCRHTLSDQLSTVSPHWQRWSGSYEFFGSCTRKNLARLSNRGNC
jgi:hypothetical protein